MPGATKTVMPTETRNFRVTKSYVIEDALTGEKLAGPFLTEQGANCRIKSLRKKNPAAFVREVKD